MKKGRFDLGDGFTPYYYGLAHICVDWINQVDLDVTLEAFGGSTKFHLYIPEHIVAKAIQTSGALLALSSTINPILPLNHRRTASIFLDINHFEFKAPTGIRVVPLASEDSTQFSIEASPAAAMGPISVYFQSLNAQIPLPERSPFNRSLLGIQLTWMIPTPPPTRISLIRPKGMVTCFTKGNYTLAFPSRPIQNGSLTSIFYRHAMAIDLTYAYSEEAKDHVFDAIGIFVLTSFAYISMGLVYWLIPRDATLDVFKVFLSLASLSFASYKVLSKYAAADRESYYSRKFNLGYIVGRVMFVNILLNLALFLILIPHLLDPSVTSKLSGIPFTKLLLTQSALLLLSALLLFFLYRAGFLTHYICDNTHCTNRLYFRFRRFNCFATGRVLCDPCERTLCGTCRLNPAASPAPVILRSSSSVTNHEPGCIRAHTRT